MKRLAPCLAALLLLNLPTATASELALDQSAKLQLASGFWTNLDFTRRDSMFVVQPDLHFNWLDGEELTGSNYNYTLQVKGRTKIISYGMIATLASLKLNNQSSSQHMTGLFAGLANFNLLPIKSLKTGLYLGMALPFGRQSFSELSLPLLAGVHLNYYYDHVVDSLNLGLTARAGARVDLFAETPFAENTTGENKPFNLLGRSEINSSFELNSYRALDSAKIALVIPLRTGLVGSYQSASATKSYHWQLQVGVTFRLTAIEIYAISFGYLFSYTKLAASHALQVKAVFAI